MVLELSLNLVVRSPPAPAMRAGRRRGRRALRKGVDRRGHQDRDPLLRRALPAREDGPPPLEPPELCARFGEDGLRRLDELAALAWLELVRLRFVPLSSLEDEL